MKLKFLLLSILIFSCAISASAQIQQKSFAAVAPKYGNHIPKPHFNVHHNVCTPASVTTTGTIVNVNAGTSFAEVSITKNGWPIISEKVAPNGSRHYDLLKYGFGEYNVVVISDKNTVYCGKIIVRN